MSNRLKELSKFLRAQRERLNPADFGFDTERKRRTPGLRREEVAQLANISTTLYTKLEQGRDVSVSVDVLENLSDALGLNRFERAYLMMVSGKLPKDRKEEEHLTIDGSYQAILDGLNKYPAYILDPKWNIVAWNRQAVNIFGDFAAFSEENRNVIWRMFMDESRKTTNVNWAAQAKEMIASFRACYGANIDKEWYREFVENLENESVEFKTMWAEYDVDRMTTFDVQIHHPTFGLLDLKHDSFSVNELRGYTLNIYVANDSPYTEQVLSFLDSNEEDYLFMRALKVAE